MSYILDALRRAETERARGAVPGLDARGLPLEADEAARPGLSPRWGLASLVVGGVALALAGGWWLTRSTTGRSSSPAAPSVPAATQRLAAAPVSDAAPPRTTSTAPAPAPGMATAPAVAPAPTPKSQAAPKPGPKPAPEPDARPAAERPGGRDPAAGLATSRAPAPAGSPPAPPSAIAAGPAPPRNVTGTTPRPPPRAGLAKEPPAPAVAPAPALPVPGSVAGSGTLGPAAAGVTGAAAPPAAASPGPAVPPAPASPPAPPAAPAEPRAIPLGQLSAAQRSELPPLAIGGAVYSESAASRFVVVNGQLVREGEVAAPGVTLERIGPRAAVLRWRELRIEVPL